VNGPSAYISVFAGRIADSGVDPIPTMKFALSLMKGTNAELIWASPREVLNLVQAADIGCHVITVTHDLIRKFSSLGKDLGEFSLDTVKMFARDAVQAGYSIV
jgi:transaldolase